MKRVVFNAYIDEEIVLMIKNLTGTGKYRNHSHATEELLKRGLKSVNFWGK